MDLFANQILVALISVIVNATGMVCAGVLMYRLYKDRPFTNNGTIFWMCFFVGLVDLVLGFGANDLLLKISGVVITSIYTIELLLLYFLKRKSNLPL